MKKRILAFLLCVCMAVTGFAYAFAENDPSGDANGDSQITPADAAFVLRYCTGYGYWSTTTRQKMRADVNHNGKVDEQDAAMILRHVVRLSLLQSIQTDQTLLNNLNKQSLLYDDDLVEWVAQFIQSIQNEKVRKVLIEGAKYLGTPYKTMDCSKFVSAAYRDAGIAKSVYPQKSSNETLNWFRTNHPEQLHETDQYSWQDWKPGCVLIYFNQTTNKASHLALYVGEINGIPVVMESRRNKCDGVRLGRLMNDYETESGDVVVLTYYVDPLG